MIAWGAALQQPCYCHYHPCSMALFCVPAACFSWPGCASSASFACDEPQSVWAWSTPAAAFVYGDSHYRNADISQLYVVVHFYVAVGVTASKMIKGRNFMLDAEIW
jgi:hypothetical protein